MTDALAGIVLLVGFVVFAVRGADWLRVKAHCAELLMAGRSKSDARIRAANEPHLWEGEAWRK